MRPIYHQIEPRVKAHIFVAACAVFLVQRLLEFAEPRGRAGTSSFSAERAMEALETVRLVTFRVGTGGAERRGRQRAAARTRGGS